jgi:hypothetical protein
VIAWDGFNVSLAWRGRLGDLIKRADSRFGALGALPGTSLDPAPTRWSKNTIQIHWRKAALSA